MGLIGLPHDFLHSFHSETSLNLHSFDCVDFIHISTSNVHYFLHPISAHRCLDDTLKQIQNSRIWQICNRKSRNFKSIRVKFYEIIVTWCVM